MCSCGRELSISLCNPMYKLTFFFLFMVDGCLCFFCNKEVSPLWKLTKHWNSYTNILTIWEVYINGSIFYQNSEGLLNFTHLNFSVCYCGIIFSYKSIFMGSKTKNWYLGTGLLRPRAQVRYACWNRRQRQITVLFCVIKSSTLLQPQFIKEGKSDRCLHLLFLWLF